LEAAPDRDAAALSQVGEPSGWLLAVLAIAGLRAWGDAFRRPPRSRSAPISTTRISHPIGHTRTPAAHASRLVRAGTLMPRPVKPPALRVQPGLADARLDGLIVDSAPLHRVAIQLLRIVGALGLALISTVAFVCGLKLYTHVSPLEAGMIRVVGGSSCCSSS
jgi:hypothetical protein